MSISARMILNSLKIVKGNDELTIWIHDGETDIYHPTLFERVVKSYEEIE